METYFEQASLVFEPGVYEANKVYVVKPEGGAGDLTFSRNSTATRVNSAGLIETVASNVPRLDYLGSTCGKLLLEPQRTNGYRNGDLNGSVVGGALPTNWAVTTPAGITTSVVARGIDNGLPYVDIRFQGTLSATYTMSVGANAEMAATAATAYTQSFYASLVSGSFGSTLLRQVLIQRNSSALYITEYAEVYTLSSSLSRKTMTLASSEVGTAFLQPRLYITGVGQTIDATIRYAGWQIEQGAYATSYIPTLGAAVTRGADAASKTGISSLIGQTEGTLFVEFDFTATAGVGVKMQISGTQRVSIYSVGTSIVGNAAGTNLFSYTQGTNERLKIAFAYKSGSSAFYVNGVQKGVSSDAFTLTSISDLFLSNNFGGSEKEIMPTHQALLFKTRLSNQQLAELTEL